VVAGQHRHGPRPGTANLHDDPAGAAGDVGAVHVAQVGADQPGAGAQADQPARAHPPRHRGLGVRQGEIPGDLRRAVGGLGPFPWQRRIGRIQVRHHPAADEPQVRPQGPPRDAGQARRAPGEPLGHRGVQQHLRHRVQAQAGAEAGELARGPQQALRPLLALRRHLRDHVPGERSRLR
jgi:hypothetical protein